MPHTHKIEPRLSTQAGQNRRWFSGACAHHILNLLANLRQVLTPYRRSPIKGNVKKYLPFGSVPIHCCLGIQPNCLNVHSRFESGLPQAESLISFRRVTRRNVSSSLWFHTLVATAPFVSETSSLTVIHFMSGNAWSYLRLVAYGFLGLSERA